MIYLKLQYSKTKLRFWEIFQGQAPLSIYILKHTSTDDVKSWQNVAAFLYSILEEKEIFYSELQINYLGIRVTVN